MSPNATMRLAALAAAVAIVLAGVGVAADRAAAPGPALAASAATIRDLMIQDVCLDAAGAVVTGVSPVDGDKRCVGERDLRPGEALPYHKHDHAGLVDRAALPQGYQRHDSFPVATAAFGVVVEHSYDFGAGDGRRFGVFDGGKGDGGDITLLSPDAASFAATEDGGAGFQLFVGPGCTGAVAPAGLARSWIIARFDAAGGAALGGDTVARLDDLPPGRQQSCPSALGAAFTRWYVRDVRYRAGPGQGMPLTLTTLISEHYGGADPATADHVERFYFTRELGSTRWERWQNTARTRDFSADQITRAAATLAASGRCSPADMPVGGAPFAMVDCREWTQIEPPQSPGGDEPGFLIAAIRERPTLPDLFAAPP